MTAKEMSTVITPVCQSGVPPPPPASPPVAAGLPVPLQGCGGSQPDASLSAAAPRAGSTSSSSKRWKAACAPVPAAARRRLAAAPAPMPLPLALGAAFDIRGADLHFQDLAWFREDELRRPETPFATNPAGRGSAGRGAPIRSWIVIGKASARTLWACGIKAHVSIPACRTNIWPLPSTATTLYIIQTLPHGKQGRHNGYSRLSCVLHYCNSSAAATGHPCSTPTTCQGLAPAILCHSGRRGRRESRAATCAAPAAPPPPLTPAAASWLTRGPQIPTPWHPYLTQAATTTRAAAVPPPVAPALVAGSPPAGAAFPIPPERLVALAKQVHATDTGIADDSVLSDDFRFE